ncbi:MAG: CoA transferase [Chloroflexi bacterium]|nr:CoA transferase [Chloroflexota bacterium]
MSGEAVCHRPGPLAPYRALDLTTEKGFLCGKILGDLGADVIKIEPAGGDPARNIGPFYERPGQPRQSLYWWAFNTSKRGITLDVRTSPGQDTLKKLAGTADFLIESFPPGYLDSLGLDYSVLGQLNPGLIFVSITPFGQSGPFRDYKMTDLVAMALGGQMYVAGDADRTPLRIGVPQAYLLGGAHAAVAAMLALQHRERTGQGQFADVSIQESIIHVLSSELPFWEFTHTIFPRIGSRRPLGHLRGRQVWPCQDGFVTFRIMGGTYGRQIQYVVDWMDKEGMAGDLKKVDWERLDISAATQQQLDSWEAAMLRFFCKHTKADLFAEATRRHIALAPSYNLEELLADKHLASRNYWTKVDHPDLGMQVTYPGPAYFLGETPWRISCRAPLLGEHNEEVLSELEIAASPADTNESLRTKYRQLSGPNKLNGPHNNALDGILVVDFSRVFSGPLVAKYLGDFGATVVKIESRRSPDLARVTAPYKGGKPHLDRSGPFVVANSSKYSLGLNMADRRGVEVAKRLIAKADVIVENFSPGVMERWGLSYEEVKKVKPDIIMFRHSIMGQTGPLAHHPGFGWNANGLAGFNHTTGWPDREATGPSVPYPDFVAPWFGVVSILAALDYRRRTSKGQCIDQSQLEAGVTMLATAILDFAVNGRDRGRRGNVCAAAVPHGAYRCQRNDPSTGSGQALSTGSPRTEQAGRDRWCAIAVNDETWPAFCRAIGNPTWTSDPRFSSFAGRKTHEDELDKLAAEWTMNYSAEDVMARLQAAGVPAGVAQTNQDLIESDPQIRHRGHFIPLKHTELGVALHQNWPIRLSLTPARIKPAPCLGEHTEMVCTQILSMSDEEFVELLGVGVLESPQ